MDAVMNPPARRRETAKTRAARQPEYGRATAAPVVDPDDYDNTTDYLYAIPGFVEKIVREQNEPLAQSVPLEEIWPDV
jgi:hypothetical protein